MKLRRCPICHRAYRERPALPRRDGKTEICPDCGQVEAMEDYINACKAERDKEEATGQEEMDTGG